LPDLIIRGGLVLTPDFRAIKADIAVEGGKIAAVGEVVGNADTVIDAKGKLVMPGLVNAHTHLSMSLLRGYAEDLPLKRWLEEKIWPVERKLKPEHVYAGALLGCLEMIKSGTTCFSDMYFYMEEVAKAVRESGLRCSLSYGVIELGDRERRKIELKKAIQLLQERDSRIRVMFGPHAPYTCSDECLLEVKELAERHKVGIHIHLSETEEEVRESIKKTGKPPISHLEEIGFLGPRVVAAHCVHVSTEEIKSLARHGVKVVHNPASNLKLSSGLAPVREMLDAGVEVALGTDGPASNNSLDMFREMRLCSLLQKLRTRDPACIRAEEVLRMATVTAARAAGWEEVGTIEPGKKADIILVNLNSPHLTPLPSVISNIIYSAIGSDVDTMIVDGKVLMQGRRVLTLDEERVMEKARRAAEDLVGNVSA
jgi:5-methylthioadenosine/S-adenosylhomocysteine deaminase